MRQSLFLLLACLCFTSVAFSGEQASRESNSQQWTSQQKRAWLYERLVARLQDPSAVKAYTENLSAMDDKQLDLLIAKYQLHMANQYKRQLQLQRAQQLQQRNFANPGFRPIVTWLPTGTNLTASGVVSPDRRYVRMSLAPFFSSIPRVDTFNYVTGESRNIYRERPQHYVPHSTSRTPQVRPQHSWYNKIRTQR